MEKKKEKNVHASSALYFLFCLSGRLLPLSVFSYTGEPLHTFGLLSIAVFVFCVVLVSSSMCLSWSNILLWHNSLSPPKICFTCLPLFFLLLLFLCSHICGCKISKFIFFPSFLSSFQNVEVFSWCGEKQWGQGRALWWQKCIFNPCEWMVPHIPQHQALDWMAALTRLFSLLITALCLFTMDLVIYLYLLILGFSGVLVFSSPLTCAFIMREQLFQQHFVLLISPYSSYHQQKAQITVCNVKSLLLLVIA